MDTPIQLIVGLGNPGNEYHQTRHNAGADFVTELARQHNTSLTPEKKFFGSIGQITIDHRPIRLLIPATFMNRSGQSVGALANFYKIPPEAILVAHDELDMEPGIAKLKIGGGHGGHNGLRDIISALGNNKNFARLRIGIGHPGNAKQVSAYVLKKAPTDEFNQTEDSIYAACQVMPHLVRGEWNAAMKQLHTS
ncbi:aminoacyl-tRNA hydrolase [Aestuariicella hydrocarbonica]|uniref:Peptidyl-tRNA hydrolase n=1 Tax=Pseudomaricurvus hydrocarbonicus TaxID=1470433 RepID=A0A9E5JUW1_9GAMM|nr:aminoacyl-tRNA hydrolase [Aestuariicella hydrocarbonica]NHO65006.1 aminoacyl-tRNA hydrolase [Aestuariicella hydrocarbonica]